MPYTDFHYTPTGTGVISGKEVLEQTEDAINDLGGQISGDVQTAIDTANNALNTANTASADAQNAVNTANTAYTAATNAQNTANTAQSTATAAQSTATSAQNDVDALETVVTGIDGRLTTTEGNVTNLTTRIGTAEGNITTLQNDVVTAQGTATSAQNTATLARGQAYVVRYAGVAVSDNSTVSYTDLNNVDNIKANDLLLDTNGKLYQISSVDTANETVSVTTPLTQLAVDSGVMHLSGNETAAGIKTFSDELIGSIFTLSRVRSKDNTNAYIVFRGSSQSDPGSLVFQAHDGTQATALHLVNKALRPYSDNDISLGTSVKRWIDVVSFLLSSHGTYIGNEASTNQRTNICLLANRDTADKSCAYITRFRQNKAQGALHPADLQKIGFDVLENGVRTNNIFDIRCTDWLNDIPQRVNFVSSAQSYSWGRSTNKSLFNDLNPGALSLPDTSNAIDISGYITPGNSNNTYTPLVDGYVSVNIGIASGGCAVFLSQGDLYNACYSATGAPDVTGVSAWCMLPVKGGVQMNIGLKGSNNYINSAKFYPCQGNV